MSGIIVAGHLCVDNLYHCGSFPKEGELTSILDIEKSTGGLVNNTAKDLARLAPDLKISVAGCVGDDPDGDYILSLLEELPNIDTKGIRRIGRTGFTNVMTNEATKTRTFFQYSGANALFSEDFLELRGTDADLLHIGYILLLPELDKEDPKYGTRMAGLLCHAKEMGLKTSVDLITEAGDRTGKLLPPALRYTDYCTINEIEAGYATGIPLRSEEDVFLWENLEPALRKLKEQGVSAWAVIHAPEGAAGIDENGKICYIKSLSLPAGFIKGTTGAGDAFCAGILIGAERGRTLSEALKLAVCSAAASLGGEDSTKGVKPESEVLELYRLYGQESEGICTKD